VSRSQARRPDPLSGVKDAVEVVAVLFHAVIEERPRPSRPGVWAGFVVPRDVVASLRPAAGGGGGPRKRIPVRGTLAGVEYRSSVFLLADGGYEFIASLGVRRRAGVDLGDDVEVEMREDVDERALDAPPDLAAAFALEGGLADAWVALPWSHQREYLLYLGDAKRPDTRARRVEQIAAAMRKRLPLRR
jgi:hypothetical protein